MKGDGTDDDDWSENPDVPDWLTDLDGEILEIMATGLILSPVIIAENLERSRTGVSQRLNSLQAGGLIEKVGRGKYVITDEGDRLVSETMDDG